MEKSWAGVAKVLRTPTRRGDRRSDDARMEAYLTLNELVEEPDTTTRMDTVTSVLPHLVRGFHMDLLECTGDALPMCLRALSYFMYHEHIASLFTLEMVQTTIDRIIHVVHNTTDQTVYLLCLWSLSKQNFDEPTHQLVPRLIDVFCLACINELQSRKIQLHALFGLHTILLKHPAAVLSREVLKKWCHVVAKGLASSDKSIRDASRKIFQEMARLQPTTVESTHDIVEWCMENLAVPAMHDHMAGDRPLEAIHVWGFVVVLLRARLARDDELLNSTFKVPEVTLRHPDSRVRVASLQHWRSVVDIFRSSPKVSDGVAADTAALWLFRNAIVDVVMRPLTVCFQEESLATVLSTACDTWHHLVGVAVADLNAFCRRVAPLTMEKCKLVMRSSWKLWWEDMVTQVLVVLMHRIDRTHDTIYVVLRDRTRGLVRRIWQVDGQEESETYDEERDDKQASAVGRSLESLSLSNTPLPPSMAAATAIESLPLQDKSVAILVMFQSALHFISTMLAPEIDPSQDKKSVVLPLWHGLVSRLQAALMVQPSGSEDAEIRKLHRRLMTKCWTLMLGCTQFQAKSAASLRDPDTAAASGGGDVAFAHRVDLLEHVLANLDLRCSEDVILESGGQLQQALAQKAAAIMEGSQRDDLPSNDEIKDGACSDLQWLRQDIFTDASVTSVFGMMGYTLVMDLAVHMATKPWPPPVGHESVDVAVLASVATILDKLAAFNAVPPELQQVLADVVQVVRSMAQANTPLHRATAADENKGASASFAREFHSRWAARARAHDNPANTPWKQDKSESASSPGSLPSPCLLQKQATLSSDHRGKGRPDHVSPPTPAVVQPANGPIRPDLVECKEPFALIKHHFPQSFRQLSGFFNIQTIGDLCAKSEADIAAMSLHDPVNTVNKALDEFVGRRARLNTLANKSPMKRKLPLTMYSPHRTPTTTPSPAAGSRSPKRRMKSAMRSLTDEVMRDDSTAKVADVVKFSVLRPDGSVRVIRPGEDSQSVDPNDAVESDTTRRPGRSPDEEPPRRDGDTPLDNDIKLISLASKVVSHLERCDVYVEKIKAHVHSGRAAHRSPARPTACWTVDERTKIGAALVEANGIMAKMARDIGQLMEPSTQSSSSLEMSGSGASWTKPSLGP